MTNTTYPVPTDAELNGSFSDNALRVMRKRYFHKREDGSLETVADMFRRTAHALALVEQDYGRDSDFVKKIEDDFYAVMVRREFMPAGRTLTNGGARTPLVANCVVLPIHDSMEGIFETLKEAALLQQAGCGLGFALDEMRPAMFPVVRSEGEASGPVSFLEVYNGAFGTIKQQGRHGANMAMMSVDHPDVLDFVRAKEVEGTIANFNISVKMTDAFMEKLVNHPDEPWMCTWEGKSVKPRRILRHPNRTVHGVEEVDITVGKLFDEIVEYAWHNGEPGIVFIDEVNRTNPLPGFGDILTSNPCVSGETLVATKKGLVPIKELARDYGGGGVDVLTDARVPDVVTSLAENGSVRTAVKTIQGTRGGLARAARVWQTGVKPVYRLRTQSGYELVATADHKIVTTEGKVELSCLTRKHRILLQSAEGPFSTARLLPFLVTNEVTGENGRRYAYNFPREWSKELGQVMGWLVGDGWLRDAGKPYAAGFTFAEGDLRILEYLKPILNGFYGSEMREIKRPNGVYHLTYGSRHFVEFFKALGVRAARSAGKRVPESLFAAPRETVVGFLQGLFSADGTVANDEKKGSRYVRLTAKSPELLRQVQLLLLNLGIKSKLYDRARAPREAFAYQSKGGAMRRYVSDGVLYELQISKSSLPIFLEKVGFLCGKFDEKVQGVERHGFYREVFEERVDTIEYVGERDVYDLSEPLTTSFIANGFVISNCGEQFLHPYDNCNLGSLNLARFVRDGEIDEERLHTVTQIAVRMLDNVIDRFNFPVKRLNEMARGNRRIGLGIMGFADMLYELRVPYDSEEGRATGRKVMHIVQKAAEKMSEGLAAEKGAFPYFAKSVFADGSRRNAALTTVAPTGTISMISDTCSGIEPNFALSFVKQDKDADKYVYLNPYLDAALHELGYDEERIAKVKKEVQEKGSIQHLTDLPQNLRRTFVTAMEISGEDHIRMQSAFQEGVDNSISKTINLPNAATREDVKRSFILAWQLKCKSCTVYRDGSRQVQILNVGTNQNIASIVGAPAPVSDASQPVAPRKRPEVLHGATYKMKTGYGNLYVTVNDDERGKPFEVFATIGKTGGFMQEQSEAICRLIALSLRSGIDADEIVDHLKGIRGPMPAFTARGRVYSLPDAIAQILEMHVANKEEKEDGANVELGKVELGKTEPLELGAGSGETLEGFAERLGVPAGAVSDGRKNGRGNHTIADYGAMPGCPDCGESLRMSEGCVSCPSCGYNRCA